jgi:hypothetical protein
LFVLKTVLFVCVWFVVLLVLKTVFVCAERAQRDGAGERGAGTQAGAARRAGGASGARQTPALCRRSRSRAPRRLGQVAPRLQIEIKKLLLPHPSFFCFQIFYFFFFFFFFNFCFRLSFASCWGCAKKKKKKKKEGGAEREREGMDAEAERVFAAYPQPARRAEEDAQKERLSAALNDAYLDSLETYIDQLQDFVRDVQKSEVGAFFLFQFFFFFFFFFFFLCFVFWL